MQKHRQSEPVQSTHPPRDDIEQLPTNQRRHLERLFEGSTALKPTNRDPKRKDTYVSDIVSVQSLLNIRTMQSQQPKRNNSTSSQDRIVINVCGDRYETHRTTLELYPDTLLGNRKKRKYYFDKTRNEYFFDRKRICFEAILYYYQSHGRLRRPNSVPIDIFLEEVTFFQLGEEALNQIRIDENIKEVKKVRLPKNRFRRYLWATMEYPDYSIMAKIVNVLSLLMILLSTISLAIETLPRYENISQLACKKVEYTSDNSLNNTNETMKHLADDIYICSNYFKSPFFILQTVCVGFFTLELLLRIISAPSIIDFIKNLMNWVDVLAVVPYYAALGMRLAGRENEINSATYLGFRLLRIIRFTRVFKFYRVFKNIKSIRVLTSTIKESIPDFFIMIIILTLLGFLFGAAAYFAEYDANGQAFDSIFKATYWGIITITSVGYGDIYPITAAGRIIACLCALFGAATIGMLVSVLVDRYQRVFARKLYINEEPIDFDDYSDDENNDIDSKGGSGQLHRRNNIKEIEDPDARAKANAAFKHDENDVIETTDISPISDIQIDNENSLSRHSSRVHFIIGYVDDPEHETSLDLLESLSSVVARKQNVGENIQLNILSDKRATSPHDVKFNVSISSEEENTDDDDDDDVLTEIVNGPGNKGNVLRKFQVPPSPQINKQLDKVQKHV